jgi:hypothetical protein
MHWFRNAKAWTMMDACSATVSVSVSVSVLASLAMSRYAVQSRSAKADSTSDAQEW